MKMEIKEQERKELIDEITLLYETYFPDDYLANKQSYEERLKKSSMQELYKQLEKMMFLGFLKSY